MTDLELMKWYAEYWAKKFPDHTLCKLDKTKDGNLVLRVDRPNWKNHNNNSKSLDDAKFAWEREHNLNQVKEQTLNLKVKLPFNNTNRSKKEYRTICCCIEKGFYTKIKSVCDKHKMSINSLIKTLLEQAVIEELK